MRDKKVKKKGCRRIVRRVTTCWFNGTIIKAVDARNDSYRRKVEKRINFESVLVSANAIQTFFDHVILQTSTRNKGASSRQTISSVINEIFNYMENN